MCPSPSTLVGSASLTSREVGLAGRVVSIVTVLVVPAQQVVDCQVHVQIGPLQLPDNDTPGLALQDHLGLRESFEGHKQISFPFFWKMEQKGGNLFPYFNDANVSGGAS